MCDSKNTSFPDCQNKQVNRLTGNKEVMTIRHPIPRESLGNEQKLKYIRAAVLVNHYSFHYQPLSSLLVKEFW
jgi:hypothetical protein